ncbi:MAG TPA: TIGR03087 family PEP-CTERM/XrtA system glycosyltransferase [Vicinamibacterales bacterium]|nr:TIGR03087 family PEP-CTERM/XrtA system glycosyltransferase [Vicinamibacterales bacterium]
MRILVLTHRLPYAPNRGDRLRAYHMLQHLREHADIELVSLVHDDEEASHVDEVRAFVNRVTTHRVSKLRSAFNVAGALMSGTPLTHALLDAAGMTATLREIHQSRRPDVVFAYCSGMARFAMQAPMDDVPMVLDFVDVDSGKWRDLAARGRAPLSWVYRREAATLGAFEGRAATRAEASLVVNAREADAAKALASTANVQVLHNGVELGRLAPVTPPSAKPRVVFCGVMNYAPNAEGMAWFVEHVWPLVRARRSDATLAVVGPDPSSAFRRMCGGDPSITIAGRVPDVREWLWDAAIGIAPLHVARGVQNKALEAIAAGLPIVVTEAVACGLPPEAAYASQVANTPPRFAEHILALLARSPEERRRIAATADLGALTWARTLEPLWPIFERAAKSQRHAGAPIVVADGPRWQSA